MSAVGVEVLRYWWDDYKKGQYIQLKYTVTKGCIVLSHVVNNSAYVGNANTCPVCAEAFCSARRISWWLSVSPRNLYGCTKQLFNRLVRKHANHHFIHNRQRVACWLGGKKNLQKNYSVALCKV